MKTTTKYLQIEDLTIDPRAQRALRPGWVKESPRNFDKDMLGVIHVSARVSGAHHVIDGQHRIRACEVADDGPKKIMARFYEGLTLQEEAAMFLALNKTKGVSAYDKFMVRKTKGEARVIDICAIVESHGLTIGTTKILHQITAVDRLEKVYTGAVAKFKRDVPDQLSATLWLLKEAWPDDIDAFDGKILGGLGAVVIVDLAIGIIDKERMVRQLSKKRAVDLIAQAQFNAKRNPISTVSVHTGMCQAICALYNVRLQSRAKRLSWNV